MRDYADAASMNEMRPEPEPSGGGDRLRQLAMRRRMVLRKAEGAPKDEGAPKNELSDEKDAEEQEEQPAVSQPDDPAEKEADETADKIADGEAVEAPKEGGGEAVHRAALPGAEGPTSSLAASVAELDNTRVEIESKLQPWHDKEAAVSLRAACERATELALLHQRDPQIMDARRRIYAVQAGVSDVCQRQLKSAMTSLDEMDVVHPVEGAIDEQEAVVSRWVDHPLFGLSGSARIPLVAEAVEAIAAKRTEIKDVARQRDPNDPGLQRDLLDARANEARMKMVVLKEALGLLTKCFSALVRENDQPSKDQMKEVGQFVDKWSEVRINRMMAQIETVLDGSYDHEPEELGELNEDIDLLGMDRIMINGVEPPEAPAEGVTEYADRRVAEAGNEREEMGWAMQQLTKVKLVEVVRLYLADRKQRKQLEGEIDVREMMSR